jgi:hypothetical protein
MMSLALVIALALTAQDRHRVGDRALVEAAASPPGALGYSDLHELRRAHLAILDPDSPGLRAAEAPAPPIALAAGTEVLIERLLKIEVVAKGAKHAFPVAYALATSGEHKGEEFYIDTDRLGSPIAAPARKPAGKGANVARTPKRRYRSQAAERQQVDAMLGQMGRRAFDKAAAEQAETYRRMTPHSDPDPASQSHRCGAPTLSGYPCQRLVIGYGYCYQHR